MLIAGLSGNEIYCLGRKGYMPGEIAVGNSVRSLGLAGALGSSLQTLAGGEIANVTQLISEGRHAAIARMEEEARRRGAVGVTGVSSELKTLSGYTEFLAQGTGVHLAAGGPREGGGFFSTAASGIQMYCDVDAGYVPMKFVMGNVAYALGLARGITGGLRTMAQGEVVEYSQMYNGIRHLALARMQEEAAALGANAVVDVDITMVPFGVGTVELLMTGTAAHHAALPQGRLRPEQVVTSELSGEELWNLASMGYVPVRLVMATSVYSLGLAAGIGTLFRSMAKGELPEVTDLVYKARENCLEHIRQEATHFGAERVIGNKLTIMEIAPGLIEIVAVGTAIRRTEGMRPETEQLIPQAVIMEESSLKMKARPEGAALAAAVVNSGAAEGIRRGANPLGCLIAGVMFLGFVLLSLLGALLRH
ncbi:MAG: heavy metal-binding domain-containing protein [Polyangiaceae bacterium]